MEFLGIPAVSAQHPLLPQLRDTLCHKGGVTLGGATPRPPRSTEPPSSSPPPVWHKMRKWEEERKKISCNL